MPVAPSHVRSHWSQLFEGFQMPPKEFYTAVEQAIAKRAIPLSGVSRVDWHEAGVLSAKREYLRVTRRELVFDICGSPFGAGFFVSWWLVAPPPHILVRLGLLMLCLVGWVVTSNILFFLVAGSFRLIGLTLLGVMLGSVVGFVGGLAAPFVFLYLMVQVGNIREDLVEAIPGVGFVYRFLLSPSTYYRIDTELMFQSATHAAVREVVEEVTRGKVVRPLTELDWKPIMRGF